MAMALGGRVKQDINDGTSKIKHSQDAGRNVPTHTIQLAEHSMLHQLYGRTTLAVNSFHHQAVADTGSRFCVTATSPDGIVEAMESTEMKPLLGVQRTPSPAQQAPTPAQQAPEKARQRRRAAQQAPEKARQRRRAAQRQRQTVRRRLKPARKLPMPVRLRRLKVHLRRSRVLHPRQKARLCMTTLSQTLIS